MRGNVIFDSTECRDVAALADTKPTAAERDFRAAEVALDRLAARKARDRREVWNATVEPQLRAIARDTGIPPQLVRAEAKRQRDAWWAKRTHAQPATGQLPPGQRGRDGQHGRERRPAPARSRGSRRRPGARTRDPDPDEPPAASSGLDTETRQALEAWAERHLPLAADRARFLGAPR